MEKIEGVELGDLIKQASNGLIAKRKQEAITLVEKLFHRIEGLLTEKKQVEKRARELDGKIATCQEKIEKLRSGDWTVLANLNKELGETKEQATKE